MKLSSIFISSLMIILACLSAAGQTDSAWKPIRIIKTEAGNFSADNLGNLYVVSNGNQLKKLNPAGDSMGLFNEVRRYGKLHSIDATNPLKVLLYYQSQSTILILDRFLNVRNVIDLRKNNMQQVKAIAQSYDNNIWLYDEQDNKLKRINDQGMVISETADFRLLFEEIPTPVRILDHDGFVYVYDEKEGLFVFDYYGALKNKYPVPGWKDFFVAGKTVIGRDDEFLYRYEPALLKMEKIALPPWLRQSIRVQLFSTRLFVQKPGVIEVYAF